MEADLADNAEAKSPARGDLETQVGRQGETWVQDTKGMLTSVKILKREAKRVSFAQFKVLVKHLDSS